MQQRNTKSCEVGKQQRKPACENGSINDECYQNRLKPNKGNKKVSSPMNTPCGAHERPSSHNEPMDARPVSEPRRPMVVANSVPSFGNMRGGGGGGARRRIVSQSSMSPTSAAYYAGPKFTVSPSPANVPLPPVSWMLSSQSSSPTFSSSSSSPSLLTPTSELQPPIASIISGGTIMSTPVRLTPYQLIAAAAAS